MSDTARRVLNTDRAGARSSLDAFHDEDPLVHHGTFGHHIAKPHPLDLGPDAGRRHITCGHTYVVSVVDR